METQKGVSFVMASGAWEPSVPHPRNRPACAASFVIVDPNLRNVVGHHFEYDRAVAEGATEAGYQTVILAARDVDPAIAAAVPVQPVFSRDIWGSAAPGSRVTVGIGKLRDNLRFGRELWRALRRMALPAQSLIFVHTVIDRQMLALALLPLMLARHRTLRFNILLRYQPDFYTGPVDWLAFRVLERVARCRRIDLTTDSARLAAQLGRLTDLAVNVLPIPHRPPAAPDAPAGGTDGVVTFVSLGNARDEKGMFEILDAIRILHRDGALEGMRFVLQCNDAAPDLRDAIVRFRDQGLPHCELLFDRLETDAYYRRLYQADVALVPYWRSIYLARTSGVFMEALSAGKPVIATDDTWMSDQLARHGAGVLCPDRDPAALAAAILHARDNRQALAAQAAARRDAWLTAHNSRSLVAAIDALAPGTPLPRTPPRRVLVLYPHDDVVGGQGGASRRVNLMLDFLVRRGLTVRVIESGNDPPVMASGALVEGIGPEPRSRLRRLAVLGAVWLASRGRGMGHRWIFWQYARMWASAGDRRHIRQLVRWSDVVILEYPFWAAAVVPIAHREGRRVILTEHDILAEQIKGARVLRAWAWRKEARALRLADFPVAVSTGDQDVLRRHGLQATLAANPTDGRLFQVARLPHPRRVVTDVYAVDLPGSRFCLFVGSRHEPNILAVQDIRRMAAALRGRADIGFVIVGACAEPFRDGNIVALGRVEDSLLLALYAACEMVLVPIPSGTGSSLKTVEGMAAGKLLLGTAVAFRGLDVVAGRHALIENDPAAYPDRIVAALADPAGMRVMEKAGQEFARAYDSRIAFQSYADLLGLPAEDDDAAPAHDPIFDASLLLIARDAQAAGQADIAEAIAHEILAHAPDSREALAILAGQAVTPDRPGDDGDAWPSVRDDLWAALADQRHHEVVTRARALLRRHPKAGELHFLLAQALDHSAQEPAVAIRHYTHALQCGFDPMRVLQARAALCLRHDQARQALKDTLRMLLLRPTMSAALRTVAVGLRWIGRGWIGRGWIGRVSR